MTGNTQWQAVDGKVIGNNGRRRVSTIGEMINDTPNDGNPADGDLMNATHMIYNLVNV